MLSKQDIERRLYMWRETEQAVRAFFEARGFVEVRTPLLVRSPGMEPNLTPFSTDLRTIHPEKQQRAALITSPEYAMKKLLGAGMEKIFTMTPVFRNQESLGAHHAPEFMMLEWYAPGMYRDLLQETEDLLNHVLGETRVWPRIPHKDAAVDAFGEPHVEGSHFFLTEYPSSQASLARLSDDGGYAERFEAYAHGLELCNGFCELLDAEEQRRRFLQEQEERRVQGKEVFPIDEALLEALDRVEGPVYGNALGLDRLLMLKYGIGDINDIQVFPLRDRFM